VSQNDLTRTIHLQIGTIQETIMVRSAAEPAGNVAGRRTDVEPSRQKAQQVRQAVSQKCAEGAPSGDIGGQILPPLKVTDVHPEYPDALKASGIEGEVTLQAVIGTDGTVRSLGALSSPHPDLERAAMDAVQRWEFSTTYLNCTPVEVPMRVTIKFVGR
jgi:TonB family protein